MTPIQYLMSQLGRLHNETALLEVCGWDEEKVDLLLTNLNNMLVDIDAPLTKNLERFCEQQDYISEHNREQLYNILEQSIVVEIKEAARAEEEYEN
ncbi:MAG TPA: hypothetical protein EYG21_00690 [Nitrospinaceae bacterium]|jgi:hypothetical protein|nr:hypothetical protein [Nitrospinaceae bacterium]